MRTGLIALGLLCPLVAQAKLKSKGEIALESRIFSDDGLKSTKDQGLAMFGRMELTHRHKPFREQLRFFGRFDALDKDRAILIVEEAWVEWQPKPLRFRIGADVLNWTATEAFHPADVLNSRNLDSDLENFEKVGEPMVAAQLRFGSGSLSLYYLPAYIAPIFPSPASRLSFAPPGVVLGDAIRLDRNGERLDGDIGLQGAVRFAYTIGPADVSIHAIHHVDRSTPQIVFDPEQDTVAPLFRTVTQLGGTYQHVIDALIVKVEAGYRFYTAGGEMTRFGVLPDIDHAQVAVGFEYGLTHESGPESTFILEGQAVLGPDEQTRRSLGNIFQRDVLIGYRLAMNDIEGTTLLASAIFDAEGADEVLINFSIERRLSDSWKIRAAGRVYHAPFNGSGMPSGLQLLRNADHVRLSLTRYF